MRNNDKMAAGLMGMFSSSPAAPSRKQAAAPAGDARKKNAHAGRPPKGQEKFIPEGGWVPQTLWVSSEHNEKIHNLSDTLGISIRDTVYQLLEKSLAQYEKSNGANLLDKPKTRSVF